MSAPQQRPNPPPVAQRWHQRQWPPCYVNTQHPMPITQDTAVTLGYTVHELLPNGSAMKLLDKGHMAYLHGG